MIVLDASALVDAFAGHDGVRRRIQGEDVHAPHLIDVEVASALRRLVAAGDVTEMAAESVLSALAVADIVRHPHTPLLGPMWALRTTVSAYDAAYVALATVLGAPLVTTDRKLAGMPQLPCDIELVS